MEPLTHLLAAAVLSSTAAGPAFDVAPLVDLPVLAIGGVAALGWALSPELAPPHCAPDRCDRADVFAIDRFVAGQYAPGWRTVSDVGIGSLFVLGAGTLLLDEGLADGAQDLVVVAESVLIANALGVLLELSTRRPRPLVYSVRAPVEERLRGTNALSFPSGHTAGAFAATLAVFSALHRLHPDDLLPYVVLAIGVTGATFVGVSRIVAGDHFPTDVLAGAILGSSVGLLIPALHDAPVRVSAGGAGALSLAVSW